MIKEIIAAATKQVTEKKQLDLTSVRFESLAEGTVAQIMHIGPFSEEGPTIAALHDFIEASGKKKTGRLMRYILVISDGPLPKNGKQ